MSEHELELRLREVARALDADAPAFDPVALRASARRRARHRWIAALADVSTGAYRVRLVRARRRLEALLEDADV